MFTAIPWAWRLVGMRWRAPCLVFTSKCRAVFQRTLQARGQVFGIKFRPGVFDLGARQSASALTDQTIALCQTWGAEGAAWAHQLSAQPTAAQACSVAEAYLLTRGLRISPARAALRDLVERMASEHTLLRVAQAAQLAGCTVRTLERRFRQHVGVSPTWVIRRYRLLEAVEQLQQGSACCLADLAAALGYFDQAHLARDFQALLGVSPSRFARERG